MSPVDGDAQPFSKESQLARTTRRYTRRVASPKRWQAIAESRQGPCLVCASPPPNELHHLIPRSQGGSDTEANIVPLCHRCHMHVEERRPAACRMLAVALDDLSYAYVIEHGGENFFERRCGLVYERA